MGAGWASAKKGNPPFPLGRVYIVGVGPGSPEYLTERARRAIEGSEVVAGFQHSLNTVREFLKDDGVLRLTLKNQDEVMRLVAGYVDRGKTCSFTATGDPMFSDSEYVDRILRHFGRAEIIPGISSVQLAASRSNLPLDKAVLMTFHVSGDIEKKKARLLESLRIGSPVILLPRPWDFMPSDIAKFLLSNRIPEKAKITVYEYLTLENERSFTGLLRDVLSRTFSDLSVVIIKGLNNQA